ncbi:MAG: hypothetical protein ACREHD_29385 [Pirellulales bacterium]
MRTQNELVIRDLKSDVASLPGRVEAALANGWQRGRTLEQRLTMNGHVCCFTCSDAPGRPSAALWLQPRSHDEWHVANVVPLAARDISDDECDSILKDFESPLQAAPSHAGTLEAKITAAEKKLDEGLSVEAVLRLKEFSSTADRSSLRESDRTVWERFVIQAHRDDALFDGPLLDEWLKAQCWPEERRRELVRDYELGRSLLWRYDEERGT